ncbi:STAS/SEC14 domain-containing protein [Hymenobacter metallicola]|uniref:STAS/SEC14 domain-containing protein n=1 Tax=Hymenobacter metallicola TaxID=2563114 RepID=A0A4Z0PZI9_9BACT|nr:STAS/SEC14 domain-containing protein [Hymenobacter metallicola]TGE22729.1 hypothetical protein E5K02_23660 [Hymenobacter metallicola]
MLPLYRIYYENAVGRVVDDPQGFARLTYHAGSRDADAMASLLGHVTRLLAQRGDGGLLVDQRLMTPFTPAEQAFVIQQWLPRTVVEGGYRFGAVILAENAFARLATRAVTTAVRDLPMRYQYFEQEPEAIAWLLHQQAGAVSQR